MSVNESKPKPRHGPCFAHVRECLESLGDMLARGDTLAQTDVADVQHKVVFASLCPRCRCQWNERNERDHLA